VPRDGPCRPAAAEIPGSCATAPNASRTCGAKRRTTSTGCATCSVQPLGRDPGESSSPAPSVQRHDKGTDRPCRARAARVPPAAFFVLSRLGPRARSPFGRARRASTGHCIATGLADGRAPHATRARTELATFCARVSHPSAAHHKYDPGWADAPLPRGPCARSAPNQHDVP
jgi:hypothetical protein